jgi:hypothetical protein
MAAPLGVLKTGSIAFTPKLPDWKQSAINDLGVGHENKVSLLVSLYSCFLEVLTRKGKGRGGHSEGSGRELGVVSQFVKGLPSGKKRFKGALDCLCER